MQLNGKFDDKLQIEELPKFNCKTSGKSSYSIKQSRYTTNLAMRKRQILNTRMSLTSNHNLNKRESELKQNKKEKEKYNTRIVNS